VARLNEVPAADPVRGAAALAEHLPRVLSLERAASLADSGWRQPNQLTLLVPISGTYQNATDSYLLRLGFQAYPEWPPSAQFVNPESLDYRYPADQHHIPRLTSSECQTHAAYQRDGTSMPIQLICCSATLEFYQVLHGVEEKHVWRSTNTFLTTLTAIRRAMVESYQGRFPRAA